MDQDRGRADCGCACERSGFLRPPNALNGHGPPRKKQQDQHRAGKTESRTQFGIVVVNVNHEGRSNLLRLLVELVDTSKGPRIPNPRA